MPNKQNDATSALEDIQKVAKSEALATFTDRSQHLRLTQVCLHDQTDSHNELVQLREWLLHPSEKLDLTGNLFVVEDVLTGNGQIILKLEPLPHARPHSPAADIRIVPRRDTGFDFTILENSPSSDSETSAFRILPFNGGAFGRTKALQSFQRSLQRTHQENQIPRFLSNTWGDRSKDRRICEEFMIKEIEAGARLGVEVVQIDDGWQKGVSRNTAKLPGQGSWEGFWKAQPDFWEPNPTRFPNGLEPLLAKAAAHNVKLGLWYAADSADDFHNWEKDAECLIRLHKRYEICHFKIDSIHASNQQAQSNLRRLFTRVISESAGLIRFDLDVTAQLRPGYFGLADIGQLFIENRYTDGHSYWPHQTLRNLWQLCWWMPPERLRMEFLNHSRNRDKYPDDPLAPSCYSPASLFATVFFSNPLGWFEVSQLPPDYFEGVPPLVRLWKDLRKELFTGTIIPVGRAPDGIAWTGFCSIRHDETSAVVLVFRELHPNTSCNIEIPPFSGRELVKCSVLAGSGKASWANDSLEVSIPEKLGWLLVRLIH